MITESPEKTLGDWNVIAENIMLSLAKRDEPFSADDFYKSAISFIMPPKVIKRLAGAMFKEFAAAGYIRKRSDYKLSERNGGATLPLWEGA